MDKLKKSGMDMGDMDMQQMDWVEGNKKVNSFYFIDKNVHLISRSRHFSSTSHPYECCIKCFRAVLRKSNISYYLNNKHSARKDFLSHTRFYLHQPPELGSERSPCMGQTYQTTSSGF